MSWRYKWSFFPTQILNSCSPRHFSSLPTVCFDVTDRIRTHKLFGRNNLKHITLTPQIVQSTLVNCTSDLIALRFFIWCAKQRNYFHDKPSFDYMVSVVGRLTNRYTTVGKIVGELESVGLVVKAQTFLLLLRIYWRAGMYSMVFETFEQMGTLGFEPKTFAHNVVMDVLFKVGRADAGVGVLKEMKSPNFLSYNVALTNLCKLNDLVNAKDVLNIMLREGYFPNVETFEMLLSCCCKLGRLMEAFQLLGVMITLGIGFSVNTWNILIDGFCRLRQPHMAFYLLEKMVRSCCYPNVITYTILFKGFVESRMIPWAFNILTTMLSEGYAPDLFLCNVLINTLSNVGRYDDAVDVFLSLPKWNLVPDSYTFSSLLSSICYSRKFNLLPKLVSGLDIEADLVVYNSLLNYFCKAGFPHLAVELYNDMICRGIVADNYSFVGLLTGLFGQKRVDDAVNVYLGIVMNYTGVDAHVHSVIIDELLKSGKCHIAIKFFRRAIKENYQLDAVSFTAAISGLVESGRTAEAAALYAQMKDFGLYPNAHMHNLLLCSFCAQGDIKMVKMLLQEIIKAGVQLKYSTFVRLRNCLIKFNLSKSPFKLLLYLWSLGLMPDEAIHELLLGLNLNIKSGDANHLLRKSYLFVDSSSSDDLPDVAASMG
ncbi:putative pentatricopeptide repeat-containing protein At1g16830 [Mercurialis annua]|uniref:putative pentatricopeptide repeat-containing protein At1g16830 n=1 Tax=Mercurialis annua TaxID=3986 RepID=UPI00215F96C5|nr:putative pentatricopeptide repeat-containing protein At1g16830 [Mercurialis annua]XP_050207069.1 putative pentatricopeptide repeat-containing protein At1g16830 [Mercurialis annua]